jgi:hypothetical protein
MTFSTRYFFQLFTIHKSNPLIIACLWMLSRYWQIMLDIESEFFFENTKWLTCFFTLNNSCQKCVDIFPCSFLIYFLRIVLCGIEWGNIGPYSLFFWYIIPFPTIFFDRCTIKRLIISTDSFIVTKW